MATKDVVELIEAAYAVDATEAEWLERLASTAAPLIDEGFGTTAYLFDAASMPVRVLAVANKGGPLDDDMVRAAVATASEDYVDGSWRKLQCATASEVPGYENQPAFEHVFVPRGIHDVLAINAYDPSGVGCWLGAMLPKRRRLRQRERDMWSRVAAHVAAGFRLRRRLHSHSLEDVEAVLSPAGKLEHAEGDAKLLSAREALKAAVHALERSRGALRHSEPGAAVDGWRALVAARWSIVDRFESDGRRFLVATQNDPKPRAPRPLTERESQVLAYAAMGHGTKLIAYELGIATSTVRVLLNRAALKLGARSRAEAVAAFKRSDPKRDR
jgi:DNA-binding CsgD family transcriptional regulator